MPDNRNRYSDSYDFLFKIMLIGDSAVGKTSLLLRYSDDSFSTTFISTIGIDFKIKTLDLEGKRIKLQIWDTAGQERFHTINTSYYRGAMGIILMYDITNVKSFQNVEMWLRTIDNFGNSDAVRMIIGNKCDLDQSRIISKAQGMAIAEKYQIPFLETSSKENCNVDLAFSRLTKDILNKHMSERELGKFVRGSRISVRSNSKKKNKCC